jgi:hypothetical protein
MFLPHFQLQTNILSLTLRSLPFSHLKLLIYRDYQHQHCAIYSSATFLLLLGNFLSFAARRGGHVPLHNSLVDIQPSALCLYELTTCAFGTVLAYARPCLQHLVSSL